MGLSTGLQENPAADGPGLQRRHRPARTELQAHSAAVDRVGLTSLAGNKGWPQLFTLIAQCRVGHRPGRIELPMRKRRPKPYPWLKVLRTKARQQVEKDGHAPSAE